MTIKATKIIIVAITTIALSISAYASPGKKGHDDNAAPATNESSSEADIDEVVTPDHELEAEGSIKISEGLIIPKLDPLRGKALFISKGCVACHSVNNIGGEDAPALDVGPDDKPMNPFDMAAKMWRGAPAMIYAQQESMDEGQILFTGRELADITAFLHSKEAQAGFSMDDLSSEAMEMLAEHDDGEAH